MVDMAAINTKLDDRRLRMLKTLVPEFDTATVADALRPADGWVKLGSTDMFRRKSCRRLAET